MKKLIFLSILTWCFFTTLQAQKIKRPDVCPACVMDTTGGYTSIVDTVKLNPICNYELLTREHLMTVHQIKLDRAKIPFFPATINKRYSGSGYSRGHVIPFEDLAWSPATAKASMDLNRNLAPERQNQNIGTELASENLERQMALSLGHVKVFAGTWGSVGTVKGINVPSEYWKLIIEPNGTHHLYIMPTTGTVDVIGYGALNNCQWDVSGLPGKLGFDPEKIIP